MLKVAVTQAAEKGKANQAVAGVLAAALAIQPWQVELVSGATARQKRFLIRGVAPEELARRIAAVLDAG
jgi:hypothetical protein